MEKSDWNGWFGDTPIRESPYAFKIIFKKNTKIVAAHGCSCPQLHPIHMWTPKFQISSLDAFKTRIQKGATDSKSSQNLGFFLSLPSRHWRFTHEHLGTDWIWVSENWFSRKYNDSPADLGLFYFQASSNFTSFKQPILGIMGSPTKIIHGGWL